MKVFLLVCIIIGCQLSKSNAAIFTVTSNADSGTGTLREAITSANANGTATTDYIYFNILATDVSDVTISLFTELPVLTSNMVIDATTNVDARFNHPNIKITLIRAATAYFSGLRLDNADHIEIYGFLFNNFKSDLSAGVDDQKAGIFLKNSSDIIIGAPNKPNCFINNFSGVLSPYSIPITKRVKNIKISSNFFGIADDGITPSANEIGINLSLLDDSEIGGDTPEEGNLLSSNRGNAIDIAGASGYVKITNNVIGLDSKKLKIYPSNNGDGIKVNGRDCIPLISKNTVCAQKRGIVAEEVNGGFVIAGNKIGTVSGTEHFGNNIGIFIRFCDKGLIGGASVNTENKIAYNGTAVSLELAYPISILRNSIYCNTAGITFKDLPKQPTQSRISTLTANGASGQYLPNAVIELFYTDDCGDCQGKTWFATLATDAAGNWSYSGQITGRVTSMGTNPDGATSAFSKPYINNSSAVITGVNCGQATGTIEAEVFDASFFQWINVATGAVVGSEKKLSGVPDGTYRLKAGQNGPCDMTSADFTIDASANGINDAGLSIVGTTCGSADGAIRGIRITNDLPKNWFTATGSSIRTADDLEGVPAGQYYFKAGPAGCEVTSKRYTIPNKDIVYKASAVNVVNATCGNANGSITIQGYQTEKPAVFTWYDAQGNRFKDTENITNLSPGKYRLVAGGDGICENEVGEFVVAEIPVPTLSYTGIQKYMSCDGKKVSTQGITLSGSTGPYQYMWIDEDGERIFNQLNLVNVPLGKYRLVVTDKNGCLAEGEWLDFTELKSTVLTVPNSFTPNGDGVNDVWQINGTMNYPLADFSVYNRGGGRVFSSRGYVVKFDGTYNGKKLPSGTYYYVIDLKSGCGVQSGSLTIFR